MLGRDAGAGRRGINPPAESQSTLKRAAIAAISKMPDTAKPNDIMDVLNKMMNEKKSAVPEITDPESVSCLELMKPFVGCAEAPEDLSVGKSYMDGYGL